MFAEFREDLGPLTLRVLYGFALTGLLAAGLRALAPLLKGDDLAVADGLWILGVAVAATTLFGLGAWVQGRRAPARMYRYSRDLSIFVTALFQAGKGSRDTQIKDILHEARTVYERETGVPVAPAVVEPRGGDSRSSSRPLVISLRARVSPATAHSRTRSTVSWSSARTT